ncbi:unnamed protein product [Dibothriocephalus latus]|uniref:Uncharacterized protein n=1 Tax=Dibothriocephalus latus TaxID=60516 RepID=A0A3P7RWE4_DIBLA|nr:unnamed protein product [Dibothriocephalus latus]
MWKSSLSLSWRPSGPTRISPPSSPLLTRHCVSSRRLGTSIHPLLSS